jgi:AcrR family transcriptional regulator
MSESARRAEILESAARLFASSGVRTSLKDIADASGILPGSIYHHFDSKEAIIVALIRRYRDDLDRVATKALEALHEPDQKPFQDRVTAFGQAIAACAVRHPAALLMTLYEPPTGASDELRQLVLQTPTAIHDAMLALLRAAQENGAVRSDVDLPFLSARLCECMLRHGVTKSKPGTGAPRVPELRCRILLSGIAVKPPSTAALDRSNALRSVKDVVARWQNDADPDDRVTHLRTVARAEFGRRGYEVTTLREIANAAGISAGAVYRLFPSKQELLASIMGAYAEHRKAAWEAVLSSASTPLEKLDALTWLYIKLLERFSDEIRIQLSLLRESPPGIRRVNPPSRWHDAGALLTAGAEANELRLEPVPIGVYARCVYDALWTPESVLRSAGVQRAHTFARATVLSGAFSRP